jgi:electron transport complex protein RnfC
VSGSGSDSTFRHGIHPAEHKDATEHLRIERMPFVRSFVLPLGQHGGKPARPVVRAGQRVRRGELIAEADGFVSTCLHAPVTGTVTELGTRRHPNGQLVPAIEIDADAFDPQLLPSRAPLDVLAMPRDEFVREVQKAGIVGLGGAAFPAHVKYAVPPGKQIRELVVNGCECEPYLTCDHRVMVERAPDVIRGVRILARQLGVAHATIGVEANKPDAVEALRDALRKDDAIAVVPLQVKYPQGAEKMLIKALFDVEVPAGKLPLDVEMVVNNVGTMVSLADWFDRGIPLIERVLTVAGPGVGRPANLLVPVGTAIGEVLRFAGGLEPSTREVVLGGPMMGQPVASLDAPVLKGTSGILAFTENEIAHPNEYTCLKCGRCLDACANFLNPSRLARLSRAGRLPELEQAYVMDCMECGACSFACPSNIPIVQLIRAAKSSIRSRRAKG